MNRRFTALALGIVLHPLASAAEISCPDLGKAVQVAPCPSEEELRYTFNGFCSDNSRLYAKDMDTCVSYQNYRQVKNIALWEAAGGEFQAYLSCDLAPAAIQAAKARGIAVSKVAKLTRVACDYGDGIVFVHRTHAACKVEGDGACAGAACKADCKD